ncbi:uncharacterized protein LOC133843893 [Drosophila sulfurigaster albostrigata]|uniref:uncharacterized protein LOC133843893 n=1 Tax=Drosophila sulfurigaster albostrigata TaxID=89887 RepID=UPI002D21E807|nr:uncharacterized protein LOC133843893 [Drosophila sulfurigaster albostrigata]
MCGFGFMAYGFDCCHRSIDFPLMPSIGTTEIKVKCKVLKSTNTATHPHTQKAS